MNMSEVTDKRQHPRQSHEMILDYTAQGKTFSDFTKDISGGGVFIKTKEAFSLGTELMLIFPVPKTKDHIEITATIVRKTNEGVGAQFEDTDITLFLDFTQ